MLRKEALKYFSFISKKVDVAASGKQEFFRIENKADGNVAVSIYKFNKKGIANKLLYSRVFDHHTNEIRLYGLGGNDVFSVTGTQQFAINVRMIGGDDVDSFYVDENLHSKEKLYIYDRSDQENILPLHSLARIKTSPDSSVNNYDKHNFIYDILGPVFSLFYSIDQGVMLRAGVGYEKHGFRKEPFAEKHLLSGSYATDRHSFILEYAAYLTKVIKKNDLRIHFLSKGSQKCKQLFWNRQ